MSDRVHCRKLGNPLESAVTHEQQEMAEAQKVRLDDLVEQLRTELDGKLLDRKSLKTHYPARKWAAGITRAVHFPDGVWRCVDILVPAAAPFVGPTASIRDQRLFLQWPHVEADGVVCSPSAARPCSAESFVAEGVQVFKEALTNAADSLSGENHQDFLDEMDVYWEHVAGESDWSVISNVTPGKASRELTSLIVDGKTFVSDNASELKDLVSRFVSPGRRDPAPEPAFLINLPSPFAPSAFPANGQDLRSLVAADTTVEPRALASSRSDHRQSQLFVLQAPMREGWFLGAVRSHWRQTPKSRQRGYGSSAATMPGFREKQRPGAHVTRATLFSARAGVSLAPLVRLDEAVTLSRSPEGLSESTNKNVALFGCGSVGSSVLDILANAGIRRFTLIDPEKLTAPNLGRHALGMQSTGANKAEALARRAITHRPWVENCESYCKAAQHLTNKEWDKVLSADLIVSCIGDAGAENHLAHSVRSRGFKKPIVFCWLEPFAVAGHTLVANDGDIHLQEVAGLDGTNAPHAVCWPADIKINRRSGGCGGVFQPYGAASLSLHASTMARTILDALNESCKQSTYVLTTVSQTELDAVGGAWSDWWRAATDDCPSDRAIRMNCAELLIVSGRTAS